MSAIESRIADAKKKARIAALRDRASHAVMLPPSLARFVARETGTVVVEQERHGTSYDRKMPAPKPYPWHPNANPTGTVMPMDQAVEANRLYLEQCSRKSGGQQARTV